ncbi:hypothetical protein [Kitasatospora camelliae]|uniref:Uncharacterized protein n=1 Tax=Kitasatospora camelliae TaxID=3156397 RepID=A0AAU8JQL5_9ACTN
MLAESNSLRARSLAWGLGQSPGRKSAAALQLGHQPPPVHTAASIESLVTAPR